MGIERFFSSLSRQFDVIVDLEKPYQKIDATHFLIDFNSIVHNVSAHMISQINKYKQKEISELDFPFTNMNSFDDILIDMVKNEIKELLNENFISENLKYIMIAIDGVPSFSKMMEQKKRRYMGDLMIQLMKSVELPINWSKNNISPGTEFMDKLSNRLKDEKFLKDCKIICNKLDGIYISDIYNPGEGEMKIMNCLRNLDKDNKNKICVYSPDSDMILLLMILNIDTILLRFDQQKSQKSENKIFNLIDVKKFKNVLIDYCQERLEIKNKKILIDEIVYIFTLFGDDFLPKLESINVGEDINQILDNYLLTLKDKGNLIISKNKEYIINHENLCYFFKLLTKYQLDDLNRNYYMSKYNNYKYASQQNFHYDLKVLKETVNLIKFKFMAKQSIINKKLDCDESNLSTCISIEDFFTFLTSKYDEKFDYNNKVEEIIGKTFDNLNRNIYQELKNEINKSKHIGDKFHNFYYFISKIFDGYEVYTTLYQNTNLIKVRDSKIQDAVIKDKSLYYLSLQPEQLLDEVILYLYMESSQFPFINFTFNPPSSYKYYMTRSYKQSDHNPKMKKLGLLNRGNERKKLDYIIQNKLDDYFYLFNPTNSFYKYKITSVERYYLVMFPDKNKKDIVKQYNIGFSWVLNYYFNNKTDILWFYPYSRTPLLTDIINMYDKNAGKLNFDEKRIFNPLESIIFITPIDESMNLNFLPKFVSNEIKDKIKLFISKNKHFFLPLSEINRILITDYKNLTDLLDCSVSIFLNKCHYKLLEKNIDPELFIKKFREIIPTKDQPFKNNDSFKCIDLKL